MVQNLAALRAKIEFDLRGRASAPFDYRERKFVETASIGIPEIDYLAGGLPRGGFTEICGPPCSGRTSFLLSALASRTAHAEVCVLVDGSDNFDPHSAQAAGVELKQLLWVRCRNIDQALRDGFAFAGARLRFDRSGFERYAAPNRASRSAQCLVSFSAQRRGYANNFCCSRPGTKCQNVRFAGSAAWLRGGALVDHDGSARSGFFRACVCLAARWSRRSR